MLTLCLVHAQGVNAEPAHFIEKGSFIQSNWFGSVKVKLNFDKEVSYRVFHLKNPPRLVVDFRETRLTADAKNILTSSMKLRAIRLGLAADGWSRIVFDLGYPLKVASVFQTPKEFGSELSMKLEKADPEVFVTTAGYPKGARPLPEKNTVQLDQNKKFVVVLDPGHGGKDPGAQAPNLNEKEIVLEFAQELAELLNDSAFFEARLTREDDQFLYLDQRLRKARELGGDVFLSLHADALEEGEAEGVAIFMLAEHASSKAAELFASRENGADKIGGADLSGQSGDVSRILASLAQAETNRHSSELAQSIADVLDNSDIETHPHLVQSAGFRVLQAPEIPSLLIELGFLSSEVDRDRLIDPVWRQSLALKIKKGLTEWYKSRRLQ